MESILLIKATGYTSMPFPRLGLAYIAAQLEKDGFDVDIIDGDAVHYRYLKEEFNAKFSPETRYIDHEIDWDYIIDSFKDKEYSIIGVSCIFTADSANTFELVRRMKKIYPNALYVGGGHHLDSEALNILTYTDLFDAIVHGEGEDVFSEIATRVSEQGYNFNFAGISGVSYVDKNTGDIIEGFPRPLKKDLDSRPFPARDKLPLKEYEEYFEEVHFCWGIDKRDSPCGILITSRGCPYPCTFCSSTNFWGRNTSLLSAKGLIAEIEMLIEKYDVKHFSIIDSTFIVSKKRVIDFCKLKIEKGLDFTWLCNGRVDLIDEELVEYMKKANCTSIGFGVETGSNYIADKMKKKSTIEDVRRAIKIVKASGILPMCYFMIGYMGETKETLQETKDFMKELLLVHGAYVDSPFIATPFPGTEFNQEAKKAGKIQTYDYSKYWLGKRDRSPDKLPFVPDDFTEEELKAELSAINKQLIEWREQVKLNFETGA